jgi:hypothetical protein
MKSTYFFYFAFIILSFSNCQNDKKCKFGTPKAIFSPQMKGVNNHLFEVHQPNKNNNASLESITLDDGSGVVVVQSGCDKLLQAYTFTLRGKFEDYDNDKWVKELIQRMSHLSTLDPSLAPLSNWVQAMEQLAPNLKLGQPIEIQAGIVIKIDKIKSPEGVALILELTNG